MPSLVREEVYLKGFWKESQAVNWTVGMPSPSCLWICCLVTSGRWNECRESLLQVNEEGGNEVNSKTGHGNFRAHNPCAPFPLSTDINEGWGWNAEGVFFYTTSTEQCVAFCSHSFPEMCSCGTLCWELSSAHTCAHPALILFKQPSCSLWD